MKGESKSQYLGSVKGIIDQLEAVGNHIDEDDVMIYIMNGLPHVYNGFKTEMCIKDTPTSLNTFYSLLTREELNIHRQQKLTPPSNASAFSSERGCSTPNHSGSRGRGKQQIWPSFKGRNFTPPSSGPTGSYTPTATPPLKIGPATFNARFAANWGIPVGIAGTNFTPTDLLLHPRQHTSPITKSACIQVVNPILPCKHPTTGTWILELPPTKQTISPTSISPPTTKVTTLSPSVMAHSSLLPASAAHH